MSKMRWRLSAFILAITLLGCAEAWRPVWKFYAENEEGWFVYDIQNLTHPSRDIVRVWTKAVYSEKVMAPEVKKLGKGYEKLSYIIRLQEIDCKDEKMRLLSVMYYSREGEVLKTFKQESSWRSISPGSIDEKLYQRVCQPRT